MSHPQRVDARGRISKRRILSKPAIRDRISSPPNHDASPSVSSFPYAGSYAEKIEFLYRKAQRRILQSEQEAIQEATVQAEAACAAARAWERHFSTPEFQGQLACAEQAHVDAELHRLELDILGRSLDEPLDWPTQELVSMPAPPTQTFVTDCNRRVEALIRLVHSRTEDLLEQFKLDMERRRDRCQKYAQEWYTKMLGKASQYSSCGARRKATVSHNLRRFDEDLDGLNIRVRSYWPTAKLFIASDARAVPESKPSPSAQGQALCSAPTRSANSSQTPYANIAPARPPSPRNLPSAAAPAPDFLGVPHHYKLGHTLFPPTEPARHHGDLPAQQFAYEPAFATAGGASHHVMPAFDPAGTYNIGGGHALTAGFEVPVADYSLQPFQPQPAYYDQQSFASPEQQQQQYFAQPTGVNVHTHYPPYEVGSRPSWPLNTTPQIFQPTNLQHHEQEHPPPPHQHHYFRQGGWDGHDGWNGYGGHASEQ
ncbi:hypothetical protein JCM10908_006621 [Rhodotorula pacifica]|uniref:uncharacterized protein n=1 Tax=Rhodotorula pacifica TaxID=1495444 RepID=UPI00317F9FB6